MRDADLPAWVAASVRLVTFVVVLPFAVAGQTQQEVGRLVVQPAVRLWDRIVVDPVDGLVEVLFERPLRRVQRLVQYDLADVGERLVERAIVLARPAAAWRDRTYRAIGRSVGRAVGPAVESVARHAAVPVWRTLAFSAAFVALVAATTWRYSGAPAVEALGWTWFRVLAPVGRTVARTATFTEWLVTWAWRRVVTTVRPHLPGRRRRSGTATSGTAESGTMTR
jgi:hypothetical protein